MAFLLLLAVGGYGIYRFGGISKSEQEDLDRFHRRIEHEKRKERMDTSFHIQECGCSYVRYSDGQGSFTGDDNPCMVHS